MIGPDMSILVYRVYDENNTNPDDVEEYQFSVVASDSRANYVFPESLGEIPGLDSTRILDNISILYGDGYQADKAEEWVDAALYNIGLSTVYPTDNNYKNIVEALAGEQKFGEDSYQIALEMDQPEEFKNETEFYTDFFNRLMADRESSNE